MPLTFLTYPCCLVIMAIEGRFHVPFGKLRPVPPRFQPDPFRFFGGRGFKSRMDDATHGETVGSTVGNTFCVEFHQQVGAASIAAILECVEQAQEPDVEGFV